MAQKEVDNLLFWEQEAANLPWFKKWKKTLNWKEPYAHWFVDGQLNASYACVDVHAKGERRDKVAIHWSSESGESQDLTYHDLYVLVNKTASVLQKLGVKKGDVVVLYLPMIPQAVATMLACARLGATHSVVFSGFSSQSLADRINDTKAKFVVTADIGYRRGRVLNLKSIVDQAIESCKSVEKIVVVKRSNHTISMNTKRDVILQTMLDRADEYVKPIPVESNHPLYILYTSGTTGKPKGLVHSTAGYLTYVYSTFKSAFDINDNTVYWCAADIGWVTGHSYIVYAPLLHGVTSIMHEGTPDYPDPGTWWSLIEKYKVSVLYTSPTALRLCKKFGNEWPKKYDLSSLQILGSVGEPINPEVWQWYHKIIGGGLCPVVDTWWQTETGGFMISPAPGRDLVKLKPGSATFPLPGIEADVVDEQGNSVPYETKGYLVIKKPWPGMTIGIHNAPERFKEVYWTKFPGKYYAGDYAMKDNEGYFWLLGRADEVLNIAGHRIGTAEVENAVVTLNAVAEAAAIGVKDEIKGEGIVLFVILQKGHDRTQELKQAIFAVIHRSIGRFVTPKGVYFVSKLPKTRSGKIMRRLLKAIVEGTSVGDVSTLEDETSIEEIKSAFSM